MSYTNSFCFVCQTHVPVMLVLGVWAQTKTHRKTKYRSITLIWKASSQSKDRRGSQRANQSNTTKSNQSKASRYSPETSIQLAKTLGNYDVFSQGPRKPGFLSCFFSPRLELELHAETSLTMDFELHLRFLSLAVRAKLQQVFSWQQSKEQQLF